MNQDRQAGILALWNDCREGSEHEYEAWYRGEHLRERVGLPGFRFGRRYIAVAGTSPRYFTYYETETPDVLASPVYLERGANPTPMTRHIMTAVFRNMSRTLCRRTRSVGDIQGPFVITASVPAGGPMELQGAWDRLAMLPDRLRAELWQSIEPASAEPSVEERIRGKDAKIAASFIATFSDVEPAMAAVGLVRNVLDAGTSPGVTIGAYRLLCSLDHQDIGA